MALLHIKGIEGVITPSMQCCRQLLRFRFPN